MGTLPEFVQEHLREAKALLRRGSVKEPLFSRETYQIEVQDKNKKKFFSFLQIKENGELADSFCSCEEGGRCIHISAGYLRVFNGWDEPLHIRFKKSLWNRLFQMASKRHGYDTGSLRLEKVGSYFAASKTKKKLFWIKAKTTGARKRLEAIVLRRTQETEETSLKFSNLPAEEIARYRAGKGSHALLFELSFWSDLAKWVMFLQDSKEPYKIEYGKGPLPHHLLLKFPQLEIRFYISEANWPWLIPALNTVKSALQVFEPEESAIEKIEYDPVHKCLLIQHQGKFVAEGNEATGIAVGNWFFIEGKGFYRRKSSPLLRNMTIPKEKMAETLTQSHKELQRFLSIHPEPCKAHYTLYFDPHQNLHIEFYIFEPGDLKLNRSACFIPWVYIDGKGFYLIKDWLFDGKEKIIEYKRVSDFINRHRFWLQGFPGFQTHLGSLESRLTYKLSEEGELTFEAELHFPEGFKEAYHFDEWIYLPGQGFYMQREGSSGLPLHPGLHVPSDEISSFIASHKEELEQVQGFFNPVSPVVRTGLTVSLTPEGLIAICPEREYAQGTDPASIRIFGNFIYVKGKGFSEILPASRLPSRFQKRVVLSPAQEPSFFTYELETLKPFILEIDRRFIKPGHLHLKVKSIAQERKKKRKEWWVELVYESEMGSVDPISIWDAFQQHKRHLFSSAGLLALKEPRFHWIRQLSKHCLDRKKGRIRLHTLEWIRLSILEQLEAPIGDSPEAVATRRLLEELNHFEIQQEFDLSKLKATLRPYQEDGFQWLWFLYCYGLSGLLCDDMGLGKTHQTMALLAAVDHEDLEKKNKYLVVCPTSVIYHWQALLQQFLPECKVCTYYGLTRSLDEFETNYHLLLTSYGILRTGRENLCGFSFEVAIFDEIQIAKNAASQTHKALRSISAKMRLGLSGTPIENRLRELKALLDIVLPFYLPPDSIFRELFIHPIEKQNDKEKKVLLARLVKPFILRRRKSEVLTDLPEKIEEIASCELSGEQQQLYKAVAVMMRDTVYKELQDKTKPVPYLHVFAALTKLKQICDHPALYLGDVKKYYEHASGKWDLFVELLAEAIGSGQKVVVFSQYLDMIAIIETYCKKKRIGFASIKGSTQDRSHQLQKFREDSRCVLFIASLLAAGVGIDLTIASIVIHYDRWWNPAKEDQATDRVHRIGQNRGVQVFKFVTKDTIEEHIHALIEKKKGLLESIIKGEDHITYLNREELLEVFEKLDRL